MNACMQAKCFNLLPLPLCVVWSFVCCIILANGLNFRLSTLASNRSKADLNRAQHCHCSCLVSLSRPKGRHSSLSRRPKHKLLSPFGFQFPFALTLAPVLVALCTGSLPMCPGLGLRGREISSILLLPVVIKYTSSWQRGLSMLLVDGEGRLSR